MYRKSTLKIPDTGITNWMKSENVFNGKMYRLLLPMRGNSLKWNENNNWLPAKNVKILLLYYFKFDSADSADWEVMLNQKDELFVFVYLSNFYMISHATEYSQTNFLWAALCMFDAPVHKKICFLASLNFVKVPFKEEKKLVNVWW